MLWKLVFVAVLVVGTWGRSIHDRVNSEGFPFEQMARLYCQASNAEDKTQEVKEAMLAFSECIKGMFDVNALKAEFEEAMRTKVFDQLFKNQCTKVPQFKSCVNGLVIGMSPCLPASVRSTGSKDIDTILDFACENDGARLTSFFKNDGPQCITEQQYRIMACGEAMTANVTRLAGENGPAVSFKMTDEERCSLAEPAADCFVAALKQCSNPIPGKLVEELHNLSDCRKESQNTEDPAAKTQVTGTTPIQGTPTPTVVMAMY